MGYDSVRARIKPASASEWIQTFLYGPARTGKTKFVASAQDDPRSSPSLLLDFEGGQRSVVGLPVDVLRISDWKDFDDVYQYLASGESPYRSVSVDSLTESHIAGIFAVVEDAMKHQSRRDDPNQVEQGDYGRALVMMRKLLRAMRNLDMHVFYTALSRTDQEPKEGWVKKPMLFGTLSEEVVGMFDATVYMGLTQEPVSKDSFRTTNMLVLQNYPKIRCGIRLPSGVTVPDEIIDPTVTKLFDAMGVTRTSA